MYKPVQPKDVFDTREVIEKNKKKRKFYLGGKELNDKQMQVLRVEAREMQNTQLWKLMTNRFEYLHQEMIFESGNWDSVLKCRAGIYNIRAMRQLLQLILDSK